MNFDKRTSTGQTRSICEQNGENRKWIGQQTASLEWARLWPPKSSDLLLAMKTSNRGPAYCVWSSYGADRLAKVINSTGDPIMGVENRKWNLKSNRKCWKLTMGPEYTEFGVVRLRPKPMTRRLAWRRAETRSIGPTTWAVFDRSSCVWTIQRRRSAPLSHVF